jgi:hypothetical protein
MTTFTEVLPARKSSKRSAIEWRPTPGDHFTAGVLTIHTDRASGAFVVDELPTAGGRGFHLRKATTGTDPEAESYAVFCSAAGAARDHCECKGFLRWGTPCKHMDACRALLANGWV